MTLGPIALIPFHSKNGSFFKKHQYVVSWVTVAMLFVPCLWVGRSLGNLQWWSEFNLLS